MQKVSQKHQKLNKNINTEKMKSEHCKCVPFCSFQSQSEVFRPDGSCLAMKSVVSCMEQSVAVAQWEFMIKNMKVLF